MATKNILVHLGDDAETDARIQAAVNVCKHFRAHLMALYYHEVKIPVGAVGRGGYLAENQEKIDKHAEALRHKVDRLCKSAKVDRPVKDLKGFARVALAPGETRTASFKLSGEDLAFFNVESGGWEVERTEYQALVGPSSRAGDLIGESFKIEGS